MKKPATIPSLPLVFLQAVDGERTHQCRCTEFCESKSSNSLIAHVKDMLRSKMEQQTKNDEKDRICKEYRKTHGKEAKEEAEKKVTREEMAKAKGEAEAAKAEKQEMEGRIRKQVEREVTTLLEATIEIKHPFTTNQRLP